MKTYNLTTRFEPYEVINVVKAVSLDEARELFANIKDLSVNDLLRVFYVMEA